MWNATKMCITLAVGIVLGFFVHPHETLLGTFSALEKRESGYEFINPILECAELAEADFSELKSFKSEITEVVNSIINQGRASHISVYFRDLNNGPWFGINERETFAAGSLLKVPLMISAFRQDEATPGFLNKKINYNAKIELPTEYYQDILPGQSIKTGNSYTIEELISRAIIYSDNDATVLAYANIDQDIFLRTHKDLGVVFPTDETPQDYISVKNYASFFRVLFNASYLSKADSEKALSLLNKVELSKGLPAGIPRDVKIAHKFGERGEGAKKQLHDCGIIYYPGRPYLLCVMNRGKDLTTLANNIAAISKTIYRQIDEQFK